MIQGDFLLGITNRRRGRIAQAGTGKSQPCTEPSMGSSLLDRLACD